MAEQTSSSRRRATRSPPSSPTTCTSSTACTAAATGKGSATAALSRIVTRGKRARACARCTPSGRHLHRLPRRGHRPDRLQRLGQVHPAAGHRRPAARRSSGKVYTDGQPSLLGVNAALMNDLTGERNVVLGGLAMGMSREQITRALPGHRRLLRHQREGRLHHAADAHLLLRHGGPAALLHRRGQGPRRADDRRGAGHRRPRSSRGAPRRRIRELRKEAGTVFLVSHNNKSIRDTCDRVLWLEKGELLHGRPDGGGPQGVREVHGQVGQAPAATTGPHRNCSGGARRLRGVPESGVRKGTPTSARKRQLRSPVGSLGGNRCVLVMCRTPRRSLVRCTT